MHNDRSAILSMVATGQITPREAERLLDAWRDGDEGILRLALCLAFVGLVLPSIANTMIAVEHAMALLLPAIERALCLISGFAQ
ncbi:MAG TPA: hypothetical protein VK720_01925 [Terracidiphilus sp.]|jgi:hypothetical protein|nr:hypothetical protein [Terracidiphilus sp.]